MDKNGKKHAIDLRLKIPRKEMSCSKLFPRTNGTIIPYWIQEDLYKEMRNGIKIAFSVIEKNTIIRFKKKEREKHYLVIESINSRFRLRYNKPASDKRVGMKYSPMIFLRSLLVFLKVPDHYITDSYDLIMLFRSNEPNVSLPYDNMMFTYDQYFSSKESKDRLTQGKNKKFCKKIVSYMNSRHKNASRCSLDLYTNPYNSSAKKYKCITCWGDDNPQKKWACEHCIKECHKDHLSMIADFSLKHTKNRACHCGNSGHSILKCNGINVTSGLFFRCQECLETVCHKCSKECHPLHTLVADHSIRKSACKCQHRATNT